MCKEISVSIDTDGKNVQLQTSLILITFYSSRHPKRNDALQKHSATT